MEDRKFLQKLGAVGLSSLLFVDLFSMQSKSLTSSRRT
jgi:hypothetical protein